MLFRSAVTQPPGADRTTDAFPLAEPNQLFRNLGGGRFEDVSAVSGPALLSESVSRGALFGDLDNDGDVDVVITNNNGPPQVLQSEAAGDSAWLGLRLVGGEPPRDRLGARVSITTPEGGTLRRRARADGSYASANDPRIVVALGKAKVSAARVEVVWPEGESEVWDSVPVGRYTTLTRGEGSAP